LTKSTGRLAEARFRQLCCLGLGREAVTPALLAELRAIVPNATSLAFFISPEGKLEGGYTENPEASLTTEIYMAEFHGRRDREPGGAFPDNVWTQFGVHDMADALRPTGVDLNSFGRSPFYNEIYRVQRSYWFMRLMARDQAGRGRAVGSITMYRGPHDRPWTAEDKQRLASLEPFVALALRDRSKDDETLTDSGKTGFILADASGRPLHVSRAGRHLLDLVQNPRVTTDTRLVPRDRLPRELVQICENLARIFDDDVHAPAPTWFHRNIWGGFQFRAEMLEGTGETAGLIGISITHQELVATHMIRRLGELPLSRRQSEVAYLLARGASHDGISRQLGISRHTAIAHGRWIYNKLSVSNRAELVEKLLTN